MANYKESTVSGTSWQRAYQVLINNFYNTTPTVTFNEEEIINTGSGILTKHISHITESFSNPTTQFNIINPIDGSVTGTASYQDVYILLSSLYLDLANKRDNPS